MSLKFFYLKGTSLFTLSLFSGHGTDYLNLALRDGGVSLTMGLANGKQEMHIKPARVRFDDHQWHKVTVHRRIQEVRMCVTYSNAVLARLAQTRYIIHVNLHNGTTYIFCKGCRMTHNAMHFDKKSFPTSF